MHNKQLHRLRYNHDYIGDHHDLAERQMRAVLWLTSIFMGVEIACGYWFGSMALLADGWHMASHSVAFGISVFAYIYAKKFATHEKYSFGTWKAGVLAGFASAVLLAVIGANVMVESLSRFVRPAEVNYKDALVIAVIGLLVNAISAVMLHSKKQGHNHHSHGIGCSHDHGHHDHHHVHLPDPVDLNHRSAYIHVIADAMTSVFAIIALAAGYYYDLGFLDSMAGVVGAILMLIWAYQLTVQTASILMDKNIEPKRLEEIRNTIESNNDNRIADFHVWQVGPQHYAAIISIVTHTPQQPEYYKNLLSQFSELVHLSIEVNSCTESACHK
ncbi:MAG: cation transporter [Alphaproteobacteria bacterium]|nr:MAG: cation transporter [Alphaproteobacteria bacterium]